MRMLFIMGILVLSISSNAVMVENLAGEGPVSIFSSFHPDISPREPLKLTLNDGTQDFRLYIKPLDKTKGHVSISQLMFDGAKAGGERLYFFIKTAKMDDKLLCKGSIGLTTFDNTGTKKAIDQMQAEQLDGDRQVIIQKDNNGTLFCTVKSEIMDKN